MISRFPSFESAICYQAQIGAEDQKRLSIAAVLKVKTVNQRTLDFAVQPLLRIMQRVLQNVCLQPIEL